jgi:4-hydroxythreonine-4-phosphate dehydrogenase
MLLWRFAILRAQVKRFSTIERDPSMSKHTNKNTTTVKPMIAISMGDPCGIGPEVVLKALANPSFMLSASPIIIGSKRILDKSLEIIGSNVRLIEVASPENMIPDGTVAVLDGHEDSDLSKLPFGHLSEAAGRASIFWARTAASLAMDGLVDAVVTGPINKAACSMAGSQYIGHMELFQSMAAAPDVATMLLTPDLRVVHLTTHKSLRTACDYVTIQNILAKIHLTAAFFSDHGIPTPKIGVAALNPHGGDEGLIGDEEITEIGPAVNKAQSAGIDVTGPIPADTIFVQAINGAYDVVLAMYHDQGHIAIKVHDWAQSVTLNLGLPFLRTSVDHGTAFDIAGQGVADETSMCRALTTATTLANGGSLLDC